MATFQNNLQHAVTGVALSVVRPPQAWHDGLCDCCKDCGVCCQTICCPLCTAANVDNMLDLNMPSCDCSAFCCIMVGTYITGAFPLWLVRGWRRQIIMRYNIYNESSCMSCLLTTCCTPCVACQVQREMGLRQQFAGGCCASAPVAQPGMADTAMNFGKDALGKFIGNAVTGNAATSYSGLWSSGLCDCSCMECVETFFCPCVVMGYIGNRIDMDLTDNHPRGDAMDVGSCCGWLYDPQGWTFANRREIMEKYYIKEETHTGTMWRIICCACCAMMQQRREMGYFGHWGGGICVKEAPARRQ